MQRFFAKKYIIAAFIIVLVGGLIAYRASRSTEDGVVLTEQTRRVRVAPISSLTNGGAPLSLLGSVRASHSATVRSETQGRITSVSVQVNDQVSAGRALATLENATQYAAVLQAEGAVEAAEAALAKTKKGTRVEQLSILATRLDNAKALLEESMNAAALTAKNAYFTADDAIRNKLDPLFNDDRTLNPQLSFDPHNMQLESDIEWERKQLEDVLIAWEQLLLLSQKIDAAAYLADAEDRLERIKTFLDQTAAAVNTLSPANESWRANVSAARAAVAGALTGITGSTNDLAVKSASVSIAEKEYEQGVSGAEVEDVQAREAALKQAQGALAAAQAQLGKTILRAPIAGTVNWIDLHVGDYVAPMQAVATIANNAALEAVAYVTEEERKRIAVGDRVVVGERLDGTITSIAPALDETTRKIEVVIALTDPQKTLTNGEAVNIHIAQSSAAPAAESGTLTLPISALQVTANGSFVYAVEGTTAHARRVTPGTILGDRIVIMDTLDPALIIAVDARGLEDGQTIEVE